MHAPCSLVGKIARETGAISHKILYQLICLSVNVFQLVYIQTKAGGRYIGVYRSVDNIPVQGRGVFSEDE